MSVRGLVGYGIVPDLGLDLGAVCLARKSHGQGGIGADIGIVKDGEGVVLRGAAGRVAGRHCEVVRADLQYAARSREVAGLGIEAHRVGKLPCRNRPGEVAPGTLERDVDGALRPVLNGNLPSGDGGRVDDIDGVALPDGADARAVTEPVAGDGPEREGSGACGRARNSCVGVDEPVRLLVGVGYGGRALRVALHLDLE